MPVKSANPRGRRGFRVVASRAMGRRSEAPPPSGDVPRYSACERAAEKQASRDEDARRLAAGEVTREELARENSPFAGLIGRVDFRVVGLPGYRRR